MQIHFKTFESCSNKDLFDLYYLRSVVFVVEQNCAYQDVDEKDLACIHVLMRGEETLLAYCRILPPGLVYKEAAIGRVVVPSEHRGQGFAKKLMLAAMDYCQTQYPQSDIVISAQKYLDKFYSELNFIKEGEDYLEDNIPHQKMRYRLTK